MARSGLRMRRHAARISTFAVTIAVSALTAAPAGAQRSTFRLEEATIADVHRAIMARQLTASQLVNEYLKRIAAYNGTCVKGAVDPATGFQLGDIEPVENAGQVHALITINQRGKRSKTDSDDSDPAMPDALEVAKQLDAEFGEVFLGRFRGEAWNRARDPGRGARIERGMEERPSGRFHFCQASRSCSRNPPSSEPFGGDAAKRLQRVGRAVEDRNGNRPKDFGPMLPARNLKQIVTAHQPHEP